MTHLLRIELPDVPGSLGMVASAMGAVGANIEALEIVEHRDDGTAVDDVFVEMPSPLLPDVVVSAVQRLDGVRVMWVSRYAAGGNLHLDLEALEAITEEPARAVQRLTDLVPATFRCDWAMEVQLSNGHVALLSGTPAAPSVLDMLIQWYPMSRAMRPEIGKDWPGWSAVDVGAAPLGKPDRIIAFGRHGGPEILDSELARLAHLATLAASIEASAST